MKYKLMAFLIREEAESKVRQQSMCAIKNNPVVNRALSFHCDMKGNPANLEVTNEK